MWVALTHIPSFPTGQREAWLGPHSKTYPACGRHPAGGLGFRFPPPPPPHVFLEDSKQCPSPEAWRPLTLVSGGEIKAREWIGHSARPQTPAQLLITLVGLPEARGHRGPGRPLLLGGQLWAGARQGRERQVCLPGKLPTVRPAPHSQGGSCPGRSAGPCRAAQGHPDWG